MKHARSDCDRFQDPEGKIPVDEPVFLVRGQDKVGWMVVVVYAVLNFFFGGEHSCTVLSLKHVAGMLAWPKKKGADLPRAR